MNKNNNVEIKIPAAGFDAIKTFECGQCFRWERDEKGTYTGVAYGRAARVSSRGGAYFLYCENNDYEEVWRDYFDLSVDYDTHIKTLSENPLIREALEYGSGIRILRQEPWETLISFIISQCNNIPRIKSIIHTLCRLYGERFEFDGEVYFAFPSAERIAALSDNDLDMLRAGYRANYIKQAAEKVLSLILDLNALNKLSTDDAKGELKKLCGVGDKVADCVLLYGYHRLDAFPVDVWMKRAIKELGIDFDGFGEIKGLAQQYAFHYIRNLRR